MTGKIIQINVKSKVPGEYGLPKHSVNSVKVSTQGLDGDYNVYRTEHKNNTLNQAVLIMPIEMIQKLNEEGWPIQSGDLGENITTKGIDYNSFEPGINFQLGEVLVEITKACDPCRNLAALSYVGKNKSREFIKTMLNRRGWYAKVLQEGRIHVNDLISGQ